MKAPAAEARLAVSVRPNPIGGRGEVGFVLGRAGRVTLRVVDVLGREVAVLLGDAAHPAGAHAAAWEPGPGLGAGVYVLVLEADGQRATRRLTVLR